MNTELFSAISKYVEALEADDFCPKDFMRNTDSVEAFTVSAQGAFLGAQVLLKHENATIWIDSRAQVIHGVLGCDQMSAGFENVLRLDSYLEECYQAVICGG